MIPTKVKVGLEGATTPVDLTIHILDLLVRGLLIRDPLLIQGLLRVAIQYRLRKMIISTRVKQTKREWTGLGA